MPKLRWTRRALRNLDEIGEYVRRHDPIAADRLVRRIRESVARIEAHPRSGRAGAYAGTREVVVAGTPYIVVYRIADTVQALRVRHAAQLWPDSLD